MPATIGWIYQPSV